MALCLILGCFYFLYWGLAINDGTFVQLTNRYFSLLTGLFFKDTSVLENYFFTGIYLFLFSIPCYFLMFFVNETEKKMILNYQKVLENKKHLEKIIEKRNIEEEFASIKTFALCVSLDFQDNKNINSSFKQKLYGYIANSLKKKLNFVEITVKNAIIIASNDFYSYSEVYAVVLEQLASAKKLLAPHADFTPTVTTDAFKGKYDIDTVLTRHYGIKKCNLQGRALTTAMFYKKYTHLNKNKYSGIPIGLYTVSSEEYDLNLVHKNLNAELLAINKNGRI